MGSHKFLSKWTIDDLELCLKHKSKFSLVLTVNYKIGFKII